LLYESVYIVPQARKWNCGSCAFVNHPHRSHCLYCGLLRDWEPLECDAQVVLLGKQSHRNVGLAWMDQGLIVGDKEAEPILHLPFASIRRLTHHSESAPQFIAVERHETPGHWMVMVLDASGTTRTVDIEKVALLIEHVTCVDTGIVEVAPAEQVDRVVDILGRVCE